MKDVLKDIPYLLLAAAILIAVEAIGLDEFDLTVIAMAMGIIIAIRPINRNGEG